jgi:hypothetical protein
MRIGKRQHTNDAAPTRPGRTFRVALLAVAADSAVAAQIAGALRDAGATVVPATGEGDRWDGLVVLMSEAALRDPAWCEIAAACAALRLVPVRLGAIAPDAVPKRLAEINWIDWRRDDPSAAFGSVIAALYADPARHVRIRQLTHEAQTWANSGRPTGLLIDDFRHASRVADLLEEQAADELVTPDPEVAAYVAASVAHSHRLRKRRRRWRIGAVVLLLLISTWAMDAVPQILDRSRMNRASVVTLGSGGVIDQSSEWAAINAAQLVLEGTKDQKQLGRRTLIQALNRPWPIGEVDFVDSPFAAAPFDHGHRAAILALARSGHSAVRSGHSGIAIVEPATGTFVGHFTLPQRLETMSAVVDGHLAVSRPGLGILDLRRLKYLDVASKGVSDAWALTGGRILSSEAHGEIVVRGADGHRTGSLGRHGAALDARSGRGVGPSTVLVRDGTTFAIVDVASRRSLARARMPHGTESAVLAPDARQAAIVGDDGQVWRLGPGARAQPTGIAVPPRAELLWPRAEKLIVMSDGTGGRVVSLPSGVTLGRICTGMPEIRTPHADPDAEVVTCDGRGFWRLPFGLVTGTAVPAMTLPRTLSSRVADAQFDGSTVRLRWHGGPGDPTISGWSAPLNSRITAATWSPSGDQLLVGSDNGGVAIMMVRRDATGVIAGADLPDQAPVAAVSWSAKPLARTATGATWPVTTCDACNTDAGLIAAARRRIGGCFTPRQLAFTTKRVQRRLGLRTCDPTHLLE